MTRRHGGFEPRSNRRGDDGDGKLSLLIYARGAAEVIEISVVGQFEKSK